MSRKPPLRLRFDAFELDEGNARLTQNGQPLGLTPKAFAVLCELAREQGQLLGKDALLDAVWGHRHVSESVLKTIVSELRAVLGDDARQPRYIETAARRGYRFVGATVSAPATPTGPVFEAPRMIGRGEALKRLRAAWNQAQAGRRQLVWVTGEAGVGKTTLIERFLAEVDPRHWVQGQCVEQFGAGEPYLPVLEGLTILCRRKPELVPELRRGAPTWMMQLPAFCPQEDRIALQRELAGATQDRMVREIRDIMDAFSMDYPILFVIEDLHWTDQATLRLMDYFVRRRSPARIMWLASFRLAEVVSADEHPLKALRHELRLHKLVDEIALDSFSEREVADFVTDRYPGLRSSEAFVRSLHRHTEGLPLFLVNVIEDLGAQGLLHEAAVPDERDVAALPVPENLAGVIEKQLARLSPGLRATLEAAAVCGVEFRCSAVAEVLQEDPARVATRCEELARRRQWLSALGLESRGDGALDMRYAFRHALYRRVVYESIGALTRAQLHRRTALALQHARDGGAVVPASELALHYERGHEPLPALRATIEAAEHALASFAPAEAVALTGRGMELLPACGNAEGIGELELSLMTTRGLACLQTRGMGSPEANAAYGRVEALCAVLPENPPLGWALGGLGWVRFGRGQYASARAMAERMQGIGGWHKDPVLEVAAHNLAGLVLASQGELELARDSLLRGIGLAAGLEGQLPPARFMVDPLVTMRSNLGRYLAQLGHVDEARLQLDAALERARGLGHPLALLQALRCAGMFELRQERPERVAAIAAELDSLVVNHSVIQAEGASHCLGGWAQARLGQAQAGYERILSAYRALKQVGMVAAFTEVLCYAADAAIQAGLHDAALAHVDEAQELAGRLGEGINLRELAALRERIGASRSG